MHQHPMLSAAETLNKIGIERGEMSALIVKLARALQKVAPEHALPAQAIDYLQRHGLMGSPLRVDA